MNFRPFLCAATALTLLAPAVLAAKPAPKLLLLQTQSRIDVDAQGNVTAVSTTPKLPADIEAFVEGNLRKLRFQPPMKDGRAVAGVTYALQDACAAPVDGSYRFAVKYRGNGPGQDPHILPSYPRDAELRGVQSSWHVDYEITPDGKAHVVTATLTKGGGGRFDGAFRGAIEKWLKASPFQPELLDGQPVATRVSNDVDFVLSAAPEAEPARQAAANDACQLALDARDKLPRAVALDSPFKLIAQD